MTFGRGFKQSLERVTLPSNLQSLAFGDGFNQNLERVTLPTNLQSLTFDSGFSQSLQGVIMPHTLYMLFSWQICIREQLVTNVIQNCGRVGDFVGAGVFPLWTRGAMAYNNMLNISIPCYSLHAQGHKSRVVPRFR